MGIAKHLGVPDEEIELGIHDFRGVFLVMNVNHGVRSQGIKMAQKFGDDVRRGAFDIGKALPGFSLAANADTPSAPLVLKHYKPDAALELEGNITRMTRSSIQKAKEAIA